VPANGAASLPSALASISTADRALQRALERAEPVARRCDGARKRPAVVCVQHRPVLPFEADCRPEASGRALHSVQHFRDAVKRLDTRGNR
jgi:hypothetical protein